MVLPIVSESLLLHKLTFYSNHTSQLTLQTKDTLVSLCSISFEHYSLRGKYT